MAQLTEVAPQRPINLQFIDRRNLQELDGFETLPVLHHDSNTITLRSGVRKPLVNEMFTRLAEAATARGSRYFGFTNSDIIVTAGAVARVAVGDRPAYVFARTDFDPATNRDLGPLIYGADVFVIEARWWLAHRARFRAYVVGESLWDNAYAAQLLCWADGLLLNREPLVRHEAHEIVWRDSPFSEHNGVLAALDRPYFSRWVLYVKRLEALRAEASARADHAPEDAERQLQEEIFHGWRPGVADRLLQQLRVAKLRLRRLKRR